MLLLSGHLLGRVLFGGSLDDLALLCGGCVLCGEGVSARCYGDKVRIGDGLTSWSVLVGSGGVTLAVGLLGLAIGLGSLVVVGALSVFFLVFLFVVIGLSLGAVSRLGLGLGLAVGLIALFGFLILFLIGILLALFLFFDAASLVSSGDVPIGRA